MTRDIKRPPWTGVGQSARHPSHHGTQEPAELGRVEIRSGRGEKAQKDSGRPATNGNAMPNFTRQHGGLTPPAVRCARRNKHSSIRYMLTADADDKSAFDLDKVRDPKTGALAQWAQQIVDIAETYTEVSPSGTGLRLFFRGKLDANQVRPGPNWKAIPASAT